MKCEIVFGDIIHEYNITVIVYTNICAGHIIWYIFIWYIHFFYWDMVIGHLLSLLNKNQNQNEIES